MSFKEIINKFGINEKLTKPVKKIKKFNKIKMNMIPIEDTNFMADLLFLPTTKMGHKYLLTCVDIANNDCDFEELKTKNPSEVKNAFIKMFKRKYLKVPMVMITDSGNEFKSEVDQYLKKEGVYHRTTLPGRHYSTANVEALNKQLGRILNGYMNKIEEETDETYKEWTDIIDELRVDLNKARHIELPTVEEAIENMETVTYDNDPKFNEGDLVHYQLNAPRDALGNKQNTSIFRVGDYRFSKDVKKIRKIVMMNDEPHYRYMLQGMNNVLWYDNELMKADENSTETHLVKRIIGKRVRNKKNEYLIWWKGQLKSNSTWEPEANLRDDLGDFLDTLIDDYNTQSKKKK
jgi:hypothetical protein